MIGRVSWWPDVVYIDDDAAGQHARAIELNPFCQDTS